MSIVCFLSGRSLWTTVCRRASRLWVAMLVIASVVCWSLLLGQSSWTTVFRHLGRHVGDRVGRVFSSLLSGQSSWVDDCLTSCQSHIFRRVGRHGRQSVVESVVCVLSGRSSWTTVFRCLGRHVGDSVGHVLVVVVMSVVCFLSGRSSWTTVSRRVSRMFLVVVWSVVMDDCLLLFGASCL